MKFSIKDFFSKRDQIRRKLWIWSHLLKNSLMENFNFCAVKPESVLILPTYIFWKENLRKRFPFYLHFTLIDPLVPLRQPPQRIIIIIINFILIWHK